MPCAAIAVPGAAPKDFKFAKDLIPVAREAGFCVGAAAYPEGHIDCLDFDEHSPFEGKQDAGAQFFVTQLFFDNELALRFLDAARKAGITAPITFGIMPFLSKAQIQRMVFIAARAAVAHHQAAARYEDDPKALRQAVSIMRANSSVGLSKEGVDGLHVYTMNRPDIAQLPFRALRDAGAIA